LTSFIAWDRFVQAVFAKILENRHSKKSIRPERRMEVGRATRVIAVSIHLKI
jgi:hypothetical protein